MVLFLLEFNAAFHCVYHTSLLQIIQGEFGICAVTFLWITSFLTHMTHNVGLSAKLYKSSTLFYCPQGPILPTAFHYYTHRKSPKFHYVLVSPSTFRPPSTTPKYK